jgi:hypothetical protein
MDAGWVSVVRELKFLLWTVKPISGTTNDKSSLTSMR